MHVQEIVANTNRTLGLIRRNVKTTSLQLKNRAYKALVHPQLEYACTVWSPWQGYLINTIEKVQHRVLLAIYITTIASIPVSRP